MKKRFFEKKVYLTKFKVEWEQAEEDGRQSEHHFLAAHRLNPFPVFGDITTVCLVGGQLGVPTGRFDTGVNGTEKPGKFRVPSVQ